jgi:hypothetical protein
MSTDHFVTLHIPVGVLRYQIIRIDRSNPSAILLTLQDGTTSLPLNTTYAAEFEAQDWRMAGEF